MKEQVMNVGAFASQTNWRERVRLLEGSGEQGGWNPEDFARKQIRGLVRQLFLSNIDRPVRQVVFSPVEPETDVRSLCLQVGEALGLETKGSIAIVGTYPQLSQIAETYAAEVMAHPRHHESTDRQAPSQLAANLWLVPSLADGGDQVTTALLHSHLGRMRTQFEYSIVVGPPAGESNEVTAMAQLADGIVLVLSADHTRRITARKIKEKLECARARVLGTVLSDRVFPIPAGIYRRL
jgi:hypothetical protein